MADIKLFDVKDDKVRELTGKSMAIEKSLQTMIEKNIEKAKKYIDESYANN